MEVFLLLNGHELRGEVDEQEQLMLQLAAGNLKRDALAEWVKQHLVPAKQ